MADRNNSLAFVAHFFTTYRRRTAAMVGLLVLAGLSEGVGLLTMLPLLELTMGAENSSRLARGVSDALRSIHIEPTLVPLLTLIVVAMTAKGIFLWFAMREVGYTIANVAAELRLRLLRGLMAARYGFFRDRPAGQILNAASTEARRAAWAYKDACSAFADFIQALIYVAVIVLVSWRIALLAPLVGGGLWLILYGMVRMSRRAGAIRTAAMQRLLSRLTALLPNIKPVKSMARERQLGTWIEEDVDTYKRAERLAVMAEETMTSFREPIIVTTMAVGLFAALTSGSMPFSLVLALAVLFYRLLMIVGRLQVHYQAMAHGESAFWSLFAEIEAAESAREPGLSAVGRRPPPSLTDGITFVDVHFAYEPESPILRDIDMVLPARRLVALTGASGGGKTSLADLLIGLITPDRGRILIDGVPLDEIDLSAWRGAIGYVPQELLLFHGTIAYNVTLGGHDLDRGDAERALRAAGAWDFVQRHAAGLDRVIGERGTKVSGGQGQRIMLARALVHRPRLLILDEATNGLDPTTEAAVCETLRSLRDELTIVAISHQPAVQRAADVVIQVANGRATLRPTQDRPLEVSP